MSLAEAIDAIAGCTGLFLDWAVLWSRQMGVDCEADNMCGRGRARIAVTDLAADVTDAHYGHTA